MSNSYIEFKCPCCHVELTEDDLIAEYDLWNEHNMYELNEDDQADIIRDNANCPECSTELEEVK